MTDDDTDWPEGKFLGFGAASTTDRRKPTKAERAEIANKRPIGFVHFEGDECRPPKPRQPNRRGRRLSSR